MSLLLSLLPPTAPDARLSSAQKGLTHEQLSKSALAKAVADGGDAAFIRIRVAASENTSTKSGEASASRLMQVCYDYYVVYYTNGVETGRDFLYRECSTVDDGSGGGGGSSGDSGGGGSGSGDGGSGGTVNSCRACGGDGGVMTALQQLTPDDFYPQNGSKPLAEYPDRCAGTQGLWNLGVANNNAETFGYLTADGKIIATATLGPMGGGSSGLVSMLSPSGGTLYFYTYPTSEGLPTQVYAGMRTITYSYGAQVFIPVVASIHTHTPCLTDKTDGVTNHTLSPPDQALANDRPALRHYIIGCNAIGSFNNSSTLPTVLGTGDLGVICSFVQ